MKSILILQNEIMEYRRPVYNGLTAFYDLTVLHSGRASVKEADRYREIITPQKLVGPFHLQPGSPLGRMINEFDAVVAMFDLRWPTYLLPLFWLKRPKYILWGHRYSQNRLACALRDRLMKRADRLLMYGDKEVERMVARGADPSKIVIAWNTSHVPNHRDTSGEPKNSLLFVGRLQPRKRLGLLIEAFARLQGRIGDAITLDIVGSGEIEDELRQAAAGGGVSHKVVFHGRIDDPERLAELFSHAYVYVSPGPVGLGVLHSLAYGVPVITLREGRHGPEFYNLAHAQNALICAGDSEIEEAMRRLCTDGELAAQLGHSAYQHYVNERPLSRMLEGFRKAIEG
jgi:glycosyltransferase involved in cell wall biosynthesis